MASGKPNPRHLMMAQARAFTVREIEAMSPRRVTQQGYVLVRISPGVWEQEHRLMMTAKLKRPLRKGETVHHKDGNRANNAQGNLELWTQSHGAGVRVKTVCCPACGKRFKP